MADAGVKPGCVYVACWKQQAEIAEADAFESGIGCTAGARSDERASPPGFEHGVPAKSAAAGASCQRAEKIGERAAHKKQHGHPEGDKSADGEECEEEIFDDAVAENIELCAEWCCETASASEVAVNAIEGDGSDGECDGCEVGCESVAEVREQSHGGKCSGDSR